MVGTHEVSFLPAITRVDRKTERWKLLFEESERERARSRERGLRGLNYALLAAIHLLNPYHVR